MWADRSVRILLIINSESRRTECRHIQFIRSFAHSSNAVAPKVAFPTCSWALQEVKFTEAFAAVQAIFCVHWLSCNLLFNMKPNNLVLANWLSQSRTGQPISYLDITARKITWDWVASLYDRKWPRSACSIKSHHTHQLQKVGIVQCPMSAFQESLIPCVSMEWNMVQTVQLQILGSLRTGCLTFFEGINING